MPDNYESTDDPEVLDIQRSRAAAHKIISMDTIKSAVTFTI